MMHATRLFGSALALATLVSIAAAATPDAPIGIAAPGALSERTLARELARMMPADVRHALCAGDAYGLEPSPSAGAGVLVLDDRYRTLAEWLTPDEYASMPDPSLDMLAGFAASVRSGVPVPAVCFAPGTPEKVVSAYEGIFRSSQLRFQQNRQWTVTAHGIAQGRGEPITLTYSYVPDGTPIPNIGIGVGSGSSVLYQWLNGIYGSPAVWQAHFDAVFARWSALAGLDYVYEPNDDGVTLNQNAGVLGVRGDVRIGAFPLQNDGNGFILAYNNYPNDGDMVFDAFDTTYNNTTSNSLIFRNVIAHEHGHGLGMFHVCPVNQTKLMEPNISLGFYGPQLDDVLNAQRFYGDPNEPDDTPALAVHLGTATAGQILQEGFATPISIADDTDTDVFEFEADANLALTIAITPAAATYLQGPQNNQVGGGAACTAGNPTDYNSIHDLSLTLLAADGTTVLGSADDNPVGSGETLEHNAEPGTYFIRVNGDQTNGIQKYQISIAATQIPCYCDLDNSSVLNVDDIDLFVLFFIGSDPRADCDGSGALNVDDIDCFVACFLEGCS